MLSLLVRSKYVIVYSVVSFILRGKWYHTMKSEHDTLDQAFRDTGMMTAVGTLLVLPPAVGGGVAHALGYGWCGRLTGAAIGGALGWLAASCLAGAAG